MSFSVPRPVRPDDNLGDFFSGNNALDQWIKTRALRNDRRAARTYVVCDGEKITGYYSLAVGSVMRELTPGNIRRNMPEQIPVMLLVRLALDREYQSKGLGRALIRDANLRTLRAAEIAGIRAILVHAIDDNAANFYRHCGFLSSPINSLVLLFPLKSFSLLRMT